MGISNPLLFCQCTAYLLAFVLALFAGVPLAQDEHELKGRCLLYAAGQWQFEGAASAGQGQGRSRAEAHWLRFRMQRWGPQSACRFGLFMGIFSCIYSALQGFRSSYILYKGFQESSFSEFISMILSSAIALLMLIASATVSDGLNVWCNSVTDKVNVTISGISFIFGAEYVTQPSNDNYSYFILDAESHRLFDWSCRDAQEEPLNLRGVNPLFYDHFGTAQFGLWCAWVVWIVLAFLAFLKISHSCNRDDVSLRYKETLLTQQSQRCFHGNVTSVFV